MVLLLSISSCYYLFKQHDKPSHSPTTGNITRSSSIAKTILYSTIANEGTKSHIKKLEQAQCIICNTVYVYVVAAVNPVYVPLAIYFSPTRHDLSVIDALL